MLPGKTITPNELKSILSAYPLGSIRSIREISSGFVNRNWQVIGNDRTVFVRATNNKTEADIRYEINLLRKIKATGLPVASPVTTVDKREAIRFGDVWITVTDYIQGHHAQVTVSAAEKVGRWMGRLHRIPITADMERSNPLTIDYARTVLNAIPDFAPFPGLAQELENLSARISGNWPRALIHGDLFPDNVMMNHQQLAAVVDFEDACTDSRLFDLGMGINGFCFVQNRFALELFDSLFDAYQTECSLTDQEWLMLPVFIRWTALTMALWHLDNAYRNGSVRSRLRANDFWQRVLSLRQILFDETLRCKE